MTGLLNPFFVGLIYVIIYFLSYMILVVYLGHGIFIRELSFILFVKK